MENLDILVAAGAYSVAGSLVLEGEELGKLINNDLHLTAAGRAKLDELAGKPTKAAAKKAPTKKAAKKGEAEPEADTEAEPEPPSLLDDPLLDSEEFKN